MYAAGGEELENLGVEAEPRKEGEVGRRYFKIWFCCPCSELINSKLPHVCFAHDSNC